MGNKEMKVDKEGQVYPAYMDEKPIKKEGKPKEYEPQYSLEELQKKYEQGRKDGSNKTKLYEYKKDVYRSYNDMQNNLDKIDTLFTTIEREGHWYPKSIKDSYIITKGIILNLHTALDNLDEAFTQHKSSF